MMDEGDDRIIQGVALEDTGIQVSYYYEDEKDSYGMKGHIAIINVMDFKPEVDEMIDSIKALLHAWEEARREAHTKPPRFQRR